MLNEERVILMTRMASYEAGEGRKNVEIGNYFRSDYISIQVLKSIISATIAFFICLGMYLFYDFETLMQEVYKMDLISFAKNILLLYGGFVIAYGIIAYAIFSIRYKKARKSLKRYYGNLKKLSSYYQK